MYGWERESWRRPGLFTGCRAEMAGQDAAEADTRNDGVEVARDGQEAGETYKDAGASQESTPGEFCLIF